MSTEETKTIEVGKARFILPGIAVTPLQAIGHAVTYRATATRDDRTWRSFVASLPGRATVKGDAFGVYAVWSVVFPFRVREAQPLAARIPGWDSDELAPF